MYTYIHLNTHITPRLRSTWPTWLTNTYTYICIYVYIYTYKHTYHTQAMAYMAYMANKYTNIHSNTHTQTMAYMAYKATKLYVFIYICTEYSQLELNHCIEDR